MTEQRPTYWHMLEIMQIKCVLFIVCIYMWDDPVADDEYRIELFILFYILNR